LTELSRRVRILLVGSRSLTTECAVLTREERKSVYCSVRELSRVVFIGMPSLFISITPITFLQI
jgi:hypothetical protein